MRLLRVVLPRRTGSLRKIPRTAIGSPLFHWGERVNGCKSNKFRPVRDNRLFYSTSSSPAAAERFADVDEPEPSGWVLSEKDEQILTQLRNIGISAHIDSGKTTLTERILYYTGKIDSIHEVRGKDNVGAKMDSMELEREKGITIQSAATFCTWKRALGEQKLDHNINIIDTPGHVDFTIEVERALRVLDGAVLVLCAVGGVQSQTMTVDRQMKRYKVPRIAFINKMDRMGANPERIVQQMRSKLALNAVLVQLPIGLEDKFSGVIDLVEMKSLVNTGQNGESTVVQPIPDNMLASARKARQALVECLADVDEATADLFIEEIEPTAEQLRSAIRRATGERALTPVFLGSAYHNKGVQALLDGVCDYLPAPHEISNKALDSAHNEAVYSLVPSSEAPLVSLAFKLEEGRFGQLTYVRVYQGVLRRGMMITNAKNGKKFKVPRLVRMHANDMEDVDAIGAGEICAMFGIDCASGDTFTDGKLTVTMTSMYVPDPVISLSIRPLKDTPNFSKALQKFQKEDPTFRVHIDAESKETIISGMGELHLDIYVERMRREYGVSCKTGKPRVAYRETITEKVPFHYTHKKQSGGSGQFARVIGYFEPVHADLEAEAAGSEIELPDNEKSARRGDANEFSNQTIGATIPSNYIPACEKAFHELCEEGIIIGHPIRNVRMVLLDGLAHAVDSSEMAFRLATQSALKEVFNQARPQVLEPIMAVCVTAPHEYQGTLLALLNKRKGVIVDTNIADQYAEVHAHVPLGAMFGFSSDLRSATSGKGEFTMEYRSHAPVYPNVQAELIEAYQAQKSGTTANSTSASSKKK